MSPSTNRLIAYLLLQAVQPSGSTAVFSRQTEMMILEKPSIPRNIIILVAAISSLVNIPGFQKFTLQRC